MSNKSKTPLISLFTSFLFYWKGKTGFWFVLLPHDGRKPMCYIIKI